MKKIKIPLAYHLTHFPHLISVFDCLNPRACYHDPLAYFAYRKVDLLNCLLSVKKHTTDKQLKGWLDFAIKDLRNTRCTHVLSNDYPF